MQERVGISQGLVQEIEAIGRRWGDWRRGELRQNQAVELLCGTIAPSLAPEIAVGREEFDVAGEIMLCQHPDCGGFVRALVRRDAYVYWLPQCECPKCGQRYVVRDF